MRLNYGTTWDGLPIDQFIETGEIMAGNTMWEIYKPLILKILGLPLTEAGVNLVVTRYINGATTGDIVATIPLTAASLNRFFKVNKNFSPLDCWSYRLRFAASTSATLRGMQLLAWAVKYDEGRSDILITK
jgi:hypothetical protein